jgi:hypothetical protein
MRRAGISQVRNNMPLICSVRQEAKSLAFHARIVGSIPTPSTMSLRLVAKDLGFSDRGREFESHRDDLIFLKNFNIIYM